MTPDLFTLKPPIPNVTGLGYFPDFVSVSESAHILAKVDSCPWQHDLKRRVQHYGFRYDYSARRVLPDAYLGPLPDWLSDISDRLVQEKLFSARPDQVIVNEYLPGQGIAPHVDCVPCFGPVIASLSLGCSCLMDLSCEDQEKEIFLEERSLLVLSGPARYKWAHGIAARKSDRVRDRRLPRGRRVSLTFRSVMI